MLLSEGADVLRPHHHARLRGGGRLAPDVGSLDPGQERLDGPVQRHDGRDGNAAGPCGRVGHRSWDLYRRRDGWPGHATVEFPVLHVPVFRLPADDEEFADDEPAGGLHLPELLRRSGEADHDLHIHQVGVMDRRLGLRCGRFFRYGMRTVHISDNDLSEPRQQCVPLHGNRIRERKSRNELPDHRVRSDMH